PPDLDAGHPALQHPPLQALGEHHVASLILFTPVPVGRSYPCSQNANTGAPPPLLHRGHAPAALHSTAPTRFRITLALRTRTHPFAQFPCPELRANARSPVSPPPQIRPRSCARCSTPGEPRCDPSWVMCAALSLHG